MNNYDAFLLVSFGGPEGMDDVMPFLRNVTRGRNIPDERLRSVAHHYEMFGGVSPINGLNREIIAALKAEFSSNGIDLPIYWGNRNWHPLLEDTVARMQDDGIKHAIAFATSAYSSYSSCRQYIEDIERARSTVGSAAPLIDKIAPFWQHPLFLKSNEEALKEALEKLPDGKRASAHIAFTAHSVPMAMADGCDYAAQLNQAAKTLAECVDCNDWAMVYQSRSGPPSQPWLEPDINDHIRELKKQGKDTLVMAPIGFVSDHMEVLYDLDTEAKQLCDELGIHVERAATAGTHPLFIRMVRELVQEHQGQQHSPCAVGCCPRAVGEVTPLAR